MIFRDKEQMNYLIKNLQTKGMEKHFSWNVISVFWFWAFYAAGVVAYLTQVFSTELMSASELSVGMMAWLLAPLLFFLVTLFLSKWEIAFLLLILTSLAVALALGPTVWSFLLFYWVGGLIGLMFQIAKEWERAIILRLGKFKKVKGPGLFLVLPFVDTVVKKVDLRIRVTDFAAETTLTLDSVPVTVDALCFWLVWDAEKAILEVENYVEAVVLSSQTALRAAISSNDLSTLLAHGEKIEEEVRKQVDRKTTDWGITIQHIEITEIKIPDELQKAMSFIAQAEREKKARILLSEAEKEIANRLVEAAQVYKDNAAALKLKSLQVLLEGFRNGNSMVLVPSGLPEELNQDNVFGLKALNEVHNPKSGTHKVKPVTGEGGSV